MGINKRNAKRRYSADPDTYRQKSIAARQALAFEVKVRLGGLCECCAESEFELLAVDHRTQDGGGARRKNWWYTYMEIRRALDSGDPARIDAVHQRFRLLCWNCNASAKNAEGVCAHDREGRPERVSAWALRMRQRFARVRAWLGGACGCCGEIRDEFLTIDHRHGDGAIERGKARGLRDVRTYYLKIERAFQRGDQALIAQLRARYRLYCHNCNQSAHRGEGVCIHRRGDPIKHEEYPYAAAVPAGAC